MPPRQLTSTATALFLALLSGCGEASLGSAPVSDSFTQWSESTTAETTSPTGPPVTPPATPTTTPPTTPPTTRVTKLPTTPPAGTRPPRPDPPPSPVPAKLAGSWNGGPGDSSYYDLTIYRNGRFVLVIDGATVQGRLDGVVKVQGAVLTLIPDGGAPVSDRWEIDSSAGFDVLYWGESAYVRS